MKNELIENVVWGNDAAMGKLPEFDSPHHRVPRPLRPTRLDSDSENGYLTSWHVPELANSRGHNRSDDFPLVKTETWTGVVTQVDDDSFDAIIANTMDDRFDVVFRINALSPSDVDDLAVGRAISVTSGTYLRHGRPVVITQLEIRRLGRVSAEVVAFAVQSGRNRRDQFVFKSD